jgi:hypothetical protein
MSELCLNQSRVQQYMRCQRKYYWKFVENFDPDRFQNALAKGKAVHHGLALRASGMSEEEAIAEAVKVIDQEAPTRLIPGDEEEIAEAKDLVKRMLPAYWKYWEEQGQTWVPLGIEVAGKVRMGALDDNTDVFLIFRIDKLANWMNQLWIVDYKTMGNLDPRQLLKYEMDMQFSLYTIGASLVLKKRVQGIIVDALVKTKVPQFAREMFIRSDEELEECQAEFLQWAQDIATAEARVGNMENPKHVYKKNTNECFSYGTCAYRPLCLKDNEVNRCLYIPRKKDYVDDTSLLEVKA